MKIVMIRPNIGMLSFEHGKDIPFDDKARMEPLQLGVLAGLTPPEIEVKLYDDRLEDIDYEAPADLVAITVEIYTARRAYEIADQYRRRKVPVILGGIHVTAMPEEAIQHADVILKGDAEGAWLQLLDDFQKDKMKSIYESKPGVGHPGYFPRRSIYENKKYQPISLLQYGRGCPFTCNFCSIGQYFKGQIHYRKIDEMIAEIKEQKRNLLFFVDDNINGDKEKAKALYREMIPLKMKWMGQSSIDMAEDTELLALMKESGCIGLVIGFESISEDGLNAYNKISNSHLKYTTQINRIRKFGIHIWASFVLGHDGETIATLKSTLDFAIKHKFSFAAFNILTPYPETPMYKKLEKQGRLKFNGKWWLDDQYRFNHAVYHPKNISHEELTDFSFHMRKKFNSFPIMARRLLARHNLINFRSLALFVYLLWLFRTETLKKQSMRLGYKVGS